MGMLEWIEEKPDFTAAVEFRRSEDGGRKAPPFKDTVATFSTRTTPKIERG